MKNVIEEQLSALVDDELDPAEMDLLLRQVGRDSRLARRLSEMYLVKEAAHRTLPDVVDIGFADRVAAALEDEPAHHSGSPRRSLRWLKPAAGLAIAASVGTLAIGIWSTRQVQDGTAASTQTVAAVAPAQADAPTQVRNVRWERLDPQVQARLNGYLVNHGENAYAGQVGAMVPHVRIAGYSPNDE